MKIASPQICLPAVKPARADAFYSAAQIAAALGRSTQAISQRLARIPADSVAINKGQQSDSWHYESLPPALRSDLDAASHRMFYHDGLHLLNEPGQPWEPRIPLNQVKPDDLAKAVKLRTALETSLQQKDAAMTASEREQAGLADYQKTFGHAITARHWRRLFHRTINRDRRQNNWLRVELYLDDNIAPQRKPRPAALAALPDDLADVIKTLENQAKPTANDRKFLFDAALRHLQETADAEPGKQAAVKRALIRGMFAAIPGLAKTEKALRCMFNRKQSAWLHADDPSDALEDKRHLKSGFFRKPDFSADEQKIRDEAILHGGNESLAHLKLRERKELSPAFVDYYRFDPRQNKSYVPATVRASITPQVEMCGPIHRGHWQAKMAGPWIPRDWSDVHPGDWFSGDDVTWNNYFYFYDDAGRLHIERGECLVLHDLRTGYILDYALIAGKYNSRHIRSLLLRVHNRHGLPFKGFYFERGVWKARIIRDLDSRENFRWRETESGLAEYNLQVRHATTPRAKPIEGLFHILQDRQRNEPGFVGFNERLEDMERMQDFLARARRGTAKPESQLLSMEQWTARLDEIFGEYIQSPQNGKMLDGQSPAEAWQAGLNRRPQRQLQDDARYLFSTHCQKIKVRQQGIVLTIGGNKLLYCNERTGQLIGRDALAFYNFDCPELLTVSDLNRQNYFTVKNISLPAMSATKEQFETVHTAIAGHRKAAKTIYGSIKHPTVVTITRDNDASEETKALGRFVNGEVEQFQQAQTATRRTLRKAQIEAAALGVNVPASIRHAGRFLEGIELEREARAQLAKEAGSTSATK
jgi:hypothetical protein